VPRAGSADRVSSTGNRRRSLRGDPSPAASPHHPASFGMTLKEKTARKRKGTAALRCRPHRRLQNSRVQQRTSWPLLALVSLPSSKVTSPLTMIQGSRWRVGPGGSRCPGLCRGGIPESPTKAYALGSDSLRRSASCRKKNFRSLLPLSLIHPGEREDEGKKPFFMQGAERPHCDFPTQGPFPAPARAPFSPFRARALRSAPSGRAAADQTRSERGRDFTRFANALRLRATARKNGWLMLCCWQCRSRAPGHAE
jgi:hypothetical protein